MAEENAGNAATVPLVKLNGHHTLQESAMLFGMSALE